MSFSIQRKFLIKIVEISSINKELIVKQTIQLQNNQFSSSSVFYYLYVGLCLLSTLSICPLSIDVLLKNTADGEDPGNCTGELQRRREKT